MTLQLNYDAITMLQTTLRNLFEILQWNIGDISHSCETIMKAHPWPLYNKVFTVNNTVQIKIK